MLWPRPTAKPAIVWAIGLEKIELPVIGPPAEAEALSERPAAIVWTMLMYPPYDGR